MLHCILGESGSGKSTIQKYLDFYIPSLKTYTTRPKRFYEKNGKHYHFISNDEFRHKLKEGFFVEYYYIEENEWFYGISLKDIDYKKRHYTLVLTPQGYRELIKKIGKEYVRSYYIKVNERERIMRMLTRQDDIDEIFRRIKSDREDFKNFDLEADMTLQSIDSNENAERILFSLKERAF